MNTLEVFGVLGLIYFGIVLLLQACRCIYVYVIKAPKRRDCIRKEKGRWAAVTGATDGIGKAYACALAKKGLNIVLISRNPKKLNDCASEITERYSVETKVIPIDFTQDEKIYSTIESVLATLEVGVLVNNVGMSYEYPEEFLDIPQRAFQSPVGELDFTRRSEIISTLVRVNIIAAMKMCEIVMPGMVERKSGVIINISSLSAVIPAPYLVVYGSTKAFIDKFSNELRNEYEGKGLVIQTVLPGYVATNMSKLRKTTWMAPSPDKFVASALSKVGIIDRTTGYFAHTVMLRFFEGLSAICHPLALHFVRSALEGIRARAIKKKAKVEES